jgi:hypothetical protein
MAERGTLLLAAGRTPLLRVDIHECPLRPIRQAKHFSRRARTANWQVVSN